MSSAPRRGSDTTLAILFDELQQLIFMQCDAGALAQVRATCVRWRAVSEGVAQSLLQARGRPATFSNNIRALAALEELEEAVGPKPPRSWHDDWLGLAFDEVELFWWSAVASGTLIALPSDERSRREVVDAIYGSRGSQSIGQQVNDFANDIAWCEQAGWPRPLAQAYQILMNNASSALALNLRQQWRQRAACVHACSEALALAAARISCDGAAPEQAETAFLAEPFGSPAARPPPGRPRRNIPIPTQAPPVYCPLSGPHGLSKIDPTWAQLGDAAPGGGDAARRVFRTRSFVAGDASLACFPDGAGLQLSCNENGQDVYEPQDSDVVELRSAPADGQGLHSLVQVGPQWFALPPFATVELEQVQPPGAWERNGHPIRRRLYTVRVSYGC